ncbi:Na+/H+ antiporter subunit D [Streptomyces sp. DSM 42041]|uniref:Na+/H+ antiporter subunit D n=1 Tax=Streptomyces hazeniae TaxID=3075538 RepID=A0ABU2NMS7_9ACTN|nr:Na+/H+ antiporter subunit D [Streptomyces sp. DSM 42041]MDT0378281.1 Na+/H+ antiporter subunit D [Streptomyces sp. DSM 42041]
MTVLLALPVLVPVLAAGMSLLTRRHVTMQTASVVVLATVLADAVALLVLADRRGPLVLRAGGWDAPVGITLVADRLSALLLSVAVAVALAVLVFAIGQGAAEERPGTASVFHPAYLLLVAGVALAFLTGDLFNLFVAFEMMLAASYVLITLDAGEPRTRAAMTYVITSLVSSLLFLTAIALLYAATGTVTLAQLAGRVDSLPEGLRTALGLLLLVVFGIKAALVPLHFWVPDSYPTAPAPITAVFAALLTKVAMYAILRTQTLVFPRTDLWVLVAVVAVAAMLLGILGAIAQEDVNRVLAFTLVSHMGFMLFGLALFDVAGLTGTILYMVHHIVVQAALFLVAGLVVARTGTSALHRMAGKAAPSAVVALLFALPALSVAGVPPFSGFVAKVALLQAGVRHGTLLAYVLAGAAVLTSLLTLYAMSRIWHRAFLRTERPEAETTPAAGRHTGRPGAGRGAGSLMVGATAGMAVIGLTVALAAGPLADIGARASQDLLRPDSYRSAVLKGAGR